MLLTTPAGEAAEASAEVGADNTVPWRFAEDGGPEDADLAGAGTGGGAWSAGAGGGDIFLRPWGRVRDLPERFRGFDYAPGGEATAPAVASAAVRLDELLPFMAHETGRVQWQQRQWW